VYEHVVYEHGVYEHGVYEHGVYEHGVYGVWCKASSSIPVIAAKYRLLPIDQPSTKPMVAPRMMYMKRGTMHWNSFLITTA
jgi:hypothetical protein